MDTDLIASGADFCSEFCSLGCPPSAAQRGVASPRTLETTTALQNCQPADRFFLLAPSDPFACAPTFIHLAPIELELVVHPPPVGRNRIVSMWQTCRAFVSYPSLQACSMNRTCQNVDRDYSNAYDLAVSVSPLTPTHLTPLSPTRLPIHQMDRGRRQGRHMGAVPGRRQAGRPPFQEEWSRGRWVD